MPTQTIGNIKVVVNNQSLGSLNVRQSNQVDSKIREFSYGQPLSLHKATDLTIASPQDGDAIIYNSTTNTFEVAPVTTAVIGDIFGGTF